MEVLNAHELAAMPYSSMKRALRIQERSATTEINEAYQCTLCEKVHECFDWAESCCKPDVDTVYECPVCHEYHDDKSLAIDCCIDLELEGEDDAS